MKKYFNITGLCIKDKHYMVDISHKIDKIVNMVEQGAYFTINRPRQFGKTTTLNALSNVISQKYIVIKTSFEGIGDDLFQSEAEFCGNIFGVWADSVKFKNNKLSKQLLTYNNSKNFRELSNAITNFIIETDQQTVLLIDEVDKSSNNNVFLQFLGLLRNKYLAASTGDDITFKSVILAGVHDVRTLKLAIRNENETRFNSPWNISAKFEIDMSFNASEISTMLTDYQKETGEIFDIIKISEKIHQFTNGYPYLVSDICKIIDEKLEADWSDNGIYTAVKLLLNEKNTLFEDVIKNIENDIEIKSVVNELLIQGKSISYNPFSYEKGIIYGIFRNDNGKLSIYNMIFEELIYNYMMEQAHIREIQIPVSSIEQSQFIINGELNIETVLLKFQSFMFEEYRKVDEKFYESQARLIFLSYLKPILNSRGFYFVEPQTRENKRLDVVVIFGNKKYIIELKIWNGIKYHEKGREQLAEYLRIQGLKDGYLLTFNFNQNKQQVAKWITVSGKNIFELTI